MTSIAVHPGEGSSSVALLKVSSIISLWKGFFYFLGVFSWSDARSKVRHHKCVICDVGLYKINSIELNSKPEYEQICVSTGQEIDESPYTWRTMTLLSKYLEWHQKSPGSVLRETVFTCFTVSRIKLFWIRVRKIFLFHPPHICHSNTLIRLLFLHIQKAD